MDNDIFIIAAVLIGIYMYSQKKDIKEEKTLVGTIINKDTLAPPSVTIKETPVEVNPFIYSNLPNVEKRNYKDEL